MREKWQKQMPLMAHTVDHPQGQELEVISNIIDANSTICQCILQDLSAGKSEPQRAGAKGMSADRTLRCAIVKTLFGFSYEELAFHIVDSHSLRWFCSISIADEGFKKSALNRNIKAISDQSWEMINRDILGYAQQENIEKGRTVRTDCTCVESNIHKPRDSNQLCDCVRVLTRLVKRSRDDFGLKVSGFSNHNRRANRRLLAILNAKNKKQRKAAYVDLLQVTDKVLGYARQAVETIKRTYIDPTAFQLFGSIEHYADLTEQVINQTKRRVVLGQKVPAGEKVLSIFEEHTDIIVKDVCFAKKRGLEKTDVCRSEYVYHRLRRFRAGIESGISWLKRCMGLARCTWKGWESFKILRLVMHCCRQLVIHCQGKAGSNLKFKSKYHTYCSNEQWCV